MATVKFGSFTMGLHRITSYNVCYTKLLRAKVFDPQPGWIFLTGKPENVNWVNYRLGQYVENVESHLGVYHLGNLNTGLWMKASPAAQAEDLLMHLEELLQDKGEASR